MRHKREKEELDQSRTQEIQQFITMNQVLILEKY